MRRTPHPTKPDLPMAMGRLCSAKAPFLERLHFSLQSLQSNSSVIDRGSTRRAPISHFFERPVYQQTRNGQVAPLERRRSSKDLSHRIPMPRPQGCQRPPVAMKLQRRRSKWDVPKKYQLKSAP